MGWAGLAFCWNTTIFLSFFSGSELESHSSSYFAKGGAYEKLHVIDIWDIVIEMCDLNWSEECSESFLPGLWPSHFDKGNLRGCIIVDEIYSFSCWSVYWQGSAPELWSECSLFCVYLVISLSVSAPVTG